MTNRKTFYKTISLTHLLTYNFPLLNDIYTIFYNKYFLFLFLLDIFIFIFYFIKIIFLF
jgi:hypothetical protein